MSRVTTRAPLLTALLAAVALTMAGCSDGEPAAEPTPQLPSPTADDTPEPDPPETSAPDLGGTPAPSETPTPSPSLTPSPTTQPPAAVGPTTYDEAAALVDAATTSAELDRFASPTGNLYCVLDSPILPPSCELARGAIPDPTTCPADGPSQAVGRIELAASGPQPVCNSDTIREPDATTLGYGAVATWPRTTVTCLMEQVGVTCVDPATSSGFFLARGLYRLL
jgi:hypothetical protein